jgi:hypothetical protein
MRLEFVSIFRILFDVIWWENEGDDELKEDGWIVAGFENEILG